MQLSTQAVPISQKVVWAGRIISALTISFLPFDNIINMLPQTLLLTGHPGGAITARVRAGSDLFSVIFLFLIGLLLGAGLFLHDTRLRPLISLPQ